MGSVFFQDLLEHSGIFSGQANPDYKPPVPLKQAEFTNPWGTWTSSMSESSQPSLLLVKIIIIIIIININLEIEGSFLYVRSPPEF